MGAGAPEKLGPRRKAGLSTRKREQRGRAGVPAVVRNPPEGFAQTEEKLCWEALREAHDEELERDPAVCVIGEDVGHYGGSYKVTYGLYKKYGDMRLLDTPICEYSFMGMGIGASMTGLRPVIEGMNMGFLLLAFSQISNNGGMLHYTSGGQFKVPAVIRGPGGVGRQLGAEHSHRLESYFQAIPGVQLVACSTPANAKALLKSAIRSDNPIIFFEHVLLYFKSSVTYDGYCQPLEKAELVREGSDVTILTYSRMRYTVEEAVNTVVQEGHDPEVIDLIALKPFDKESILTSLKKTHRVIIVEEGMRSGSIGASISSWINENHLDELDFEVQRLSSQDVPTPYAKPLEDATIIQPYQVRHSNERVHCCFLFHLLCKHCLYVYVYVCTYSYRLKMLFDGVQPQRKCPQPQLL